MDVYYCRWEIQTNNGLAWKRDDLEFEYESDATMRANALRASGKNVQVCYVHVILK